jgi:hypothetical protein
MNPLHLELEKLEERIAPTVCHHEEEDHDRDHDRDKDRDEER